MSFGFGPEGGKVHFGYQSGYAVRYFIWVPSQAAGVLGPN